MHERPRSNSNAFHMLTTVKNLNEARNIIFLFQLDLKKSIAVGMTASDFALWTINSL